MTASSDTGIEIRSAAPGTKRRRAGLGLALLLVAAGAAGGIYVALHSSPGGGGSPSAASFAHRYRSSLGWSIRYPGGVHVEHSGADGWGYGAHETTFASFAPSHGVLARITPGMQSIRLVSPRAASGRLFSAHGVALRILSQWSHVPVLRRVPPATTHLPLRLSQFHNTPRSWYGNNPRPVWHSLIANGQSYQILVWIGKRASTKQRALVERMLASLSVHRVSRARPTGS